jgi:ABC-type nitrate/sulfonate/bicarbonate transport system substrate-binding protein
MTRTIQPGLAMTQPLRCALDYLFAVLVAATPLPALAQAEALRTPLASPVSLKLGMLNVPALSPLWLLPEYAAKYNIQIDTVQFQRFADARTALASGDIQLTAFGPQDITLGLGQGVKTLVGIAGVGLGNDCLIVRKGEDVTHWAALADKRIGIGAGSISWLKFAASVQENGMDYAKLKVVNIVGGGGNYLRALQGMGVAWTAVIVAEMIAVKSGLGYVLWDAYYVGRMDICVATMISVGLLGLASDHVIVYASRLVLRWRSFEAHG